MHNFDYVNKTIVQYVKILRDICDNITNGFELGNEIISKLEPAPAEVLGACNPSLNHYSERSSVLSLINLNEMVVF